MGRQKLLSASNASAYVLLTVGAVVLINLIGTRVFGRIDLTENHVYTLAPGSKAIVANLPDYLTVKAYISKDLPPELQSVSRYVRDLLEEYSTYSKGKLRFEGLDPDGRQEDRGRGRPVQGAEAAGAGDALPEVRGGLATTSASVSSTRARTKRSRRRRRSRGSNTASPRCSSA